MSKKMFSNIFIPVFPDPNIQKGEIERYEESVNEKHIEVFEEDHTNNIEEADVSLRDYWKKLPFLFTTSGAKSEEIDRMRLLSKMFPKFCSYNAVHLYFDDRT